MLAATIFFGLFLIEFAVLFYAGYKLRGDAIDETIPVLLIIVNYFVSRYARTKLGFTKSRSDSNGRPVQASV